VGVVKKIPRPLSYPGRTVWGSVGECVFVGDVVPGNGNQPGIGVFLSERESREVLAAWGWPTPKQHESLLEEKQALEAEVERLNGLCAELEATQIKVVPVSELEQSTKQRAKAAA
jgi:hypothetical protein